MNRSLSTLGESCEVISGGTPRTSEPSFWDGEIDWATPKDLSRLKSNYIDRTERRITKKGLENCSATILPPYSVLFSSRAPIGYVAINTTPMATNQGFKSFVPKPDILDSRYLFYWLFSKREDLKRMGNGATFKEISKQAISRVKILLPPLPEQQRLAEILDKADAIRRQRKEAIRVTEALLRSAFLEMFGDPITNPKGWDVKPLGELLGFLTSGSRGWAEYYANQGDLFLRIQNVKNDLLDLEDVAFVQAPDSAEAKRTLVTEGDVLLSITADLGRTAVVPSLLGRAFINQHLALLRPHGIHAEYLSSFLASSGGQSQIQKLNKGGVKAGLNFNDIRTIRILLPPKRTQEGYATIKSKVRQLEKQNDHAELDAEKLFQSLLHRAFRGELSR